MLAALDAQAKHVVAFDLEADDDTHYVLTEALREFAARERWQAEENSADDGRRLRLAERAEAMIALTEKA